MSTDGGRSAEALIIGSLERWFPLGARRVWDRRSGPYAEGVFRILAILLLVVPILEIWVLIRAAEVVGGFNAIALMILISAAAAFLVRREGLGLLMRFQQRVNAGELPTKELLDGLLVAMAGALMLTPGFVTDAVGLLCLLLACAPTKPGG